MGKRTTSGRGDAAETPVASITGAERDELLDLPDESDAYPDQVIKRQLFSSRTLASDAKKLEADLLAHSELTPGFAKELERRASVLERTELAWQSARKLRANPALVKARVEGEEHKRLAMRALRYFLRHDLEVQARLDDIAHGTGDADLVDDLRKLAQLLSVHAPRLTKAQKRLGKDPAGRARSIARAIETEGQDLSFDVAAVDALSLRNRAYSHLMELDSEIREAGRYTYEDDGKRIEPFLLRSRSGAHKSDADDEAPDAGEEDPSPDAQAKPAADDTAPPASNEKPAKGSKKDAGSKEKPAKKKK